MRLRASAVFSLVLSCAAQDTARSPALQPTDRTEEPTDRTEDGMRPYLPRLFAMARCAGTYGQGVLGSSANDTCSDSGPVCKASSCDRYDSWLYIPHQGFGGLDDRIWVLSHAGLLATSLCARLVTGIPGIQLSPKHNPPTYAMVDADLWWDRYLDLGNLGNGTTLVVSDAERGPETSTAAGDPKAASYFPEYVIGPSNADTIREGYEEARKAAEAKTPFVWQVEVHFLGPGSGLWYLYQYDLGCDPVLANTTTPQRLDQDDTMAFFSESQQVAQLAAAALAGLAVAEGELHTLHIRRGDVAEKPGCDTSVEAVKQFMQECDALSPMEGQNETLVFFTDEIDPAYLAGVMDNLKRVPRWGGRVYHGDRAVMDVLSEAEQQDNYFVYAVASAVMARSQRQWAIRATRNTCSAQDSCTNPLLSAADAESQLQAERSRAAEQRLKNQPPK